jgi:succinylarginine dihydrolase
MKLIIAGHEWPDQSLDGCCIRAGVKNGGGACLMTRAVLFEAQESDINGDFYPHAGTLNRSEYVAIAAARTDHKLRCDAMMSAIREMCG